ncbi:MAG: transposase [Ruminococcaceae bacterium]|nr:transposase [Oscillospiraceae bacterium]
MENTDFPKRKPNRLGGFDYSTPKGYFITICTENRSKILSTIVGEGLAPPEIQLTQYGKIVKEQLLLLENRYSNLQIDSYAIMPNHIHIIFVLLENTGGASPSPTISDIVCAFKSQCVRNCRRTGFEGKLFQRSFHDHIIRNQNDYEEISKYIYENPINWKMDEFYS